MHASDLWHAVSVPRGERWSWVVWFRTCARCSMADSADWYRGRADGGSDPIAMFLHARQLAPSGARASRAGAAAQTEAARWLRASADMGFGPAAHQLGLAYASGEGVPVDLQAAARWMAYAAGIGRLLSGSFMPLDSIKHADGASVDQEGEAENLMRYFRADAGSAHESRLRQPETGLITPSKGFEANAQIAGGPTARSRAGVDLARLLLRAIEMGWPNPMDGALRMPARSWSLLDRIAQRSQRRGSFERAESPSTDRHVLSSCGSVLAASPEAGRAGSSCKTQTPSGGGPYPAHKHDDIASQQETCKSMGTYQLALALLRRAAAEGHLRAKRMLDEAMETIPSCEDAWP